MSPELRIAMLRARALAHRKCAAHLELAANAVRAGQAISAFTAAARRGDISDVAEHPDLAELDLQLDGYYG